MSDPCMTGCGRLALWCGECADRDGDALRAVAEAARCIAGKEHLGGTHKCVRVEMIHTLRAALAKLDGGR